MSPTTWTEQRELEELLNETDLENEDDGEE